MDWILLDQAGQNGAELARLDAQGRALGASPEHRESLGDIVADPRIPLDANLSKRVLRGPVIACCTSFGSGCGHAVRRAREGPPSGPEPLCLDAGLAGGLRPPRGQTPPQFDP